MSNDTTDPIIRFSAIRLLKLFWPIVVLSAISYTINPKSWQFRAVWTDYVFVTVGLLAVLGAFVLPRKIYLQLSNQGLIVHRFGSETLYAWNDVFHFRQVNGSIVRPGRIVWNITNESHHRTPLIETTRSMLGYDVSLLDTFDVRAPQLCQLLNDWQETSNRETVDRM